MGVYGLWRLLDASGKPVPLESLEGKVLAIDISIWIYQVLQGYQDRHGASRPNAHLLGLFTRICKLLYHRIKPVFVFDGGVPMLKKNTIALRRKQKSIAMGKAQKMKADLINNLIKHSVVKTVLNKDSKMDQNNEAAQIVINVQSKHPEQDMFVLPDMPSTSGVSNYFSDNEYDSDTSFELSPRKQSKWMGNIHNVDVNTNEFKALPADVRYEILTDLRETRKQNSWGRLYEMPEESQQFSSFQMKRLLKRRYVQESLESAEKEMGGRTLTLEELDKLLTEQGIDTKGRDAAFRIAADSTTRLIYISDKNALARDSVDKESETIEHAASRNASEEIEPVAGPSNPIPIVENINEYQLDDDDSDGTLPTCDEFLPIVENVNEYTFDSDWDSEVDINESRPPIKKYFGKQANPALTYMLEYTGLSQNEIMHLLKHNKDEDKITRKNMNTPEREIRLRSTKSRNPTNDKHPVYKQTFEFCKEIPESAELSNEQDINKIHDDVSSEFVQSSPESNYLIEDKSIQNNVESSRFIRTNNVNSNNGITLEKYSSPVKSSDVTQIDTSESDSDDFIEIQDVPIPEVDTSKIATKKENIEIIIKSDKKLEDDLFADIFEKTDKNITLTNLEQEQFVGIKDEYQAAVISTDSNNSEKFSLETIFEESITEKKNIELESTQLNEEILHDEKKIHNTPSFNKLVDQNNINSHTEVGSCNEQVKEKPIVLPTNKEDLIELKEHLEDEQEELARNIGKFERQATNISDQIKIEAQELLRLFGIPYIVAPMEAEAQCAYLEQINLVDGTITDDSDIWLFGGQCVYKNFFNNNKRVLQFRASDIQHHFKLSRNQLIQLAILVGSDYTTGVAGIGPVTALEILAAFPAEGDNVLHGLHNFCSWIKKGRIAALGKTGLRNKLRNVKLDRDFPSQAVVQAYLFPTVDESKETFTWDKPNIVLLCDYTRQKFGWTKGKFDDTMIPVLRRIEESKSQKLLDLYFKAKASPVSIQPNLSKRVQKALRKLNNEDNIEMENVDGKTQVKRRKKNDASQKSKEDKVIVPDDIPFRESETLIEEKSFNISDKLAARQKSTEEYIPQRERDKACALKKRLHAIEVFRKSKQGLVKAKKVKRTVRTIKKEAELSESNSD